MPSAENTINKTGWDRYSSNLDLAQLAGLSAKIGRDISLVQGAGGNTSVKVGNLLWIKASGMWLADALKKPIFCSVNLKTVIEAMESDQSGEKLDQAIKSREKKLRPSIETSLHALLPHKVVLHVHAIDAIVWLVKASGQDEIQKCLSGMNWKWVPYRGVGAPLMMAVREVLASKPDILLLANHGIVIGGGDVQQVETLLTELISRLYVPVRFFGRKFLDRERVEMAQNGAQINMHPVKNDDIHLLAKDPTCFSFLGMKPLYPDQVVYLGPEIPKVKKGESIQRAVERWKTRFGTYPDYLVVQGLGVLISSTANSAVEEMLLGHTLLLRKLSLDTKMIELTEKEISILMNWEAELYRKRMNVRD